jgi:hypothetical protein
MEPARTERAFSYPNPIQNPEILPMGCFLSLPSDLSSGATSHGPCEDSNILQSHHRIQGEVAQIQGMSNFVETTKVFTRLA